MIDKEIEWIVSEEFDRGFKNVLYTGYVRDKFTATVMVGGRYFQVDFYLVELKDKPGVTTYIRPQLVSRIVNSKEISK